MMCVRAAPPAKKLKKGLDKPNPIRYNKDNKRKGKVKTMKAKDLMTLIDNSITLASTIDGYDTCDDNKIRAIKNDLKTIKEYIGKFEEKTAREEVIISVTERLDGSTDIFKVTKEQWCAIAKIVDYYGFNADYNFETINDIQKLY